MNDKMTLIAAVNWIDEEELADSDGDQLRVRNNAILSIMDSTRGRSFGL